MGDDDALPPEPLTDDHEKEEDTVKSSHISRQFELSIFQNKAGYTTNCH